MDAHHGDLRRLEPGGWARVYLNGAPAAVDVDHDTLTRSILPLGLCAGRRQLAGVAFGTRFREKAPVGSGIDEIRLFKRALSRSRCASCMTRPRWRPRTVPRLQRDLLALTLDADASVAAAKRHSATRARRTTSSSRSCRRCW